MESNDQISWIERHQEHAQVMGELAFLLRTDRRVLATKLIVEVMRKAIDARIAEAQRRLALANQHMISARARLGRYEEINSRLRLVRQSAKGIQELSLAPVRQDCITLLNKSRHLRQKSNQTITRARALRARVSKSR